MKNLLLNLADWRARLKRAPLAIFLDYDGTLSAIAPTPSKAMLPRATRNVLKALAGCKDVKVAVISGRALRDLRRMVPVRGVACVGSHGLEFHARGTPGRSISGTYLQELRGLNSRLKRSLAGSRGVLFEPKPFSLAIHYRQADTCSQKKIKRMVLDTCHDAVRQRQVSIMAGKKMVEIIPADSMNKGNAVEKLLCSWGKKKYLPIFIGDDRTDETAFSALRAIGLTVKVGSSRSRSGAEYYLGSVTSVRKFLIMLLRFRHS